MVEAKLQWPRGARSKLAAQAGAVEDAGDLGGEGLQPVAIGP
ncbi:MAG: hypothetical protein ACI9U2_004394, partial [Bradymonadia bacterium]